MVKAKLQGTKSGEPIGRKPTWLEDELSIALAILTADTESHGPSSRGGRASIG